MAESGGQPEIFPNQNDIHVIRIGPDTPLTLEGQVPLEANIDEIPGHPATKTPSDFHDGISCNEYDCGLEEKYFEPYRLAPDRQTVARCHRDVNMVVKDTLEAMDRDGGDSFPFGWKPEKVVDAEEVATAMGISVSLDSLTERTVGGRYCRRASNFHDTAIPSVAALYHRAVKISLIYEFVVKHRGLRDVRSERSRWTGADDTRDRRDGDRERSHSGVKDHGRRD